MLAGYTLRYSDASHAAADWVSALPPVVTLIFDSSPVVAELPSALLGPVLSRADWISANSEEAAVLTGLADARQAARALAGTRSGRWCAAARRAAS